MREYLIVDPFAKTLEQYISQDNVFNLAAKLGVGERYVSQEIAGFEVEVEVIFG